MGATTIFHGYYFFCVDYILEYRASFVPRIRI